MRDACINSNGSVTKESQRLKKDLSDSKKQVKQLNRELKKKDAALAETAALLVLRKKAQAIWGGARGRMIPASDRKIAVELIEESIQDGARQFMAYRELNISERTFTRWKNPSTPLEDQRPGAFRPTPSNKMTPAERKEIIKIAASEKYQSLPPSQIVPRLADEEQRYIASESTMYRVLKDVGMNNHRGRSSKPQKRAVTSHKTTGPNQVWMWDIT